MQTVRSISALLRDRPALDAPAEERAAWFDRKAQVFDQIAADSAGQPLAQEAAELAAAARAEADRIRTGGDR